MKIPKVTWPDNLRDIPMSKMEPGQIAIILDEGYTGLVVRCYGDGSIHSISSNTYWEKFGPTHNSPAVRLLPPGTKIEFFVE